MMRFIIGSYHEPDDDGFWVVEGDVIEHACGDKLEWIKTNLTNYRLIKDSVPDMYYFGSQARIILETDEDGAVLYKLRFGEDAGFAW